MKFGVCCPVCKKAVTVDHSQKVICPECGHPYKVDIRVTPRGFEKELAGPARVYVTPLESKSRMRVRAGRTHHV